MFIEGKNAVRQAIENGTTINKVMIDKNLSSRKDELVCLIAQHKIKIEYLPKTVLDKKSKTSHHQGFIAEAVDFVYSELEDILAYAEEKGDDPFIVLLDGIEDPHNFGAIIRSCECAGVHGIIEWLTSCPASNLIRSSMVFLLKNLSIEKRSVSIVAHSQNFVK